MLLTIYLGTVVTTVATTALVVTSLDKKIKREGYVLVKKDSEKKSISENILRSIPMVLTHLLPVYNVCFVLKVVNYGPSLLDDIMRDGIIKGELVRKTEQTEEKLNNDSEAKDSSNKSKTNPTMTMGYTFEKPFNEMTAEEKVEALLKEREFLLNSCNALLEQDMKKIKQ